MAKNTYSETIIAQGVRVEGNFTAEGDVIIEGEVRGTISTAGDLKIGDAARVEADVQAQNAIISGEVRGNLRIAGRLELLATSKFYGDLVANVLSVDAGAMMNGTVRMGQEAEEASRKTMRPNKRQTSDVAVGE
jgi:cytoskeletal protein CcmA (bactofilin family)